jgi:hypothetical protein
LGDIGNKKVMCIKVFSYGLWGNDDRVLRMWREKREGGTVTYEIFSALFTPLDGGFSIGVGLALSALA